jgi:hypothetical protein
MLRSAAASKPDLLEKAATLMKTDNLNSPPGSQRECAEALRHK